MLQIGEFAALTGLSVKALRHYEQEGVLCPAAVDAVNGYRLYHPGQVHDGVVTHALRRAGVSLPAVAEVIVSGSGREALVAHQQEVAATRQQEDLALDRARRILIELESPLDIFERQMPAQPFVGVVLPAPTSDDDVDRADAAARESTLVSRLIAEDLGPIGRPWTSARARDVQSTQYLLCWPTSRPVPQPWARDGEIVGMLPERTELVTRRHVEHDTTSGSLHSQMVALFGALASRDADVRGLEVRQQVMGLRESSHTLEVATDLR